MKIKDELKGDVLVLSLSGKVMGGPDVDIFNGKVHHHVDAGRKKVVLDLSKVEWMSSVGLGMMISAHTTLAKQNGRLIVANIPKSIDSLLTITKLVTILEAKDSIDEAMASF